MSYDYRKMIVGIGYFVNRPLEPRMQSQCHIDIETACRYSGASVNSAFYPSWDGKWIPVLNNLPEYLRDPELSIDNFRRQLKTFLFAQYWRWHPRALETLVPVRSINLLFTLHYITYLHYNYCTEIRFLPISSQNIDVFKKHSRPRCTKMCNEWSLTISPHLIRVSLHYLVISKYSKLAMTGQITSILWPL